MKRNSTIYLFAGLTALISSIFINVVGLVSGICYLLFYLGKLEVNKTVKISAVGINIVALIALIIFVPFFLLTYLFPSQSEYYFGDGYGFVPLIALLFVAGIFSLIMLFVGVVKALKQRKLNQKLTPKSY